MPFDQPLRFGVVLAKLRSKYRKANSNAAKSFLRAAMKNRTNKIDSRPLVNQKWLKGADLEPIFQFLG